MFGNKIKVGHNVIKVVPLDARRLYLDTSNVAFINTEMNDDGNVEMISIEDKITILRGDVFKVSISGSKTVYEANYMIVDKKGRSVIIYTATPSKTELFLLPVLGKSQKQLKYDTYFVSAKLDYTHDFLCLTYRFTGSEEYKKFEKYIMTAPLFVSHLEHGKHHVTYIFKIPLKFNEDVVSFIEGKYSKFSKALINHIRRFHGAEGSKPLLDIIKRSKSLRRNLEDYLGLELPANSELASKPDTQTEIYQPYERSK